MFAIEDGRKYLAQWDTGQRLIIEDPTITEVHFAKTRELAAVSLVETEGERRVCKIPNVCLQPPRDLVFWLVVTDPDGSSSVVHQGIIPVLRRQKPDDYVESEDDILRWIALDARLTDLEQNSIKTVNGQAPDENGNINVKIAEEASAIDALEALAECGIVTPAYQDGVFYTDADGAIYVL